MNPACRDGLRQMLPALFGLAAVLAALAYTLVRSSECEDQGGVLVRWQCVEPVRVTR